jgi:hypothetical protein
VGVGGGSACTCRRPSLQAELKAIACHWRVPGPPPCLLLHKHVHFFTFHASETIAMVDVHRSVVWCPHGCAPLDPHHPQGRMLHCCTKLIGSSWVAP